MSVCFDGLGEALAIVIRYCSGWTIKQKLVRSSMLAKPLRGEELAREVLSVLSTVLGISSKFTCYNERSCISDKLHSGQVLARRSSSVNHLQRQLKGCFQS